MKRNVWFAPGRVISTRTIGEMTGTQWALAKQAHPQIVDMTLRKYNFVSSWMTSASNISAETMLNTSKKSSNNIMKSQQIGGGTKYVSLRNHWKYKNKQVHLSMPGYVAKALKRFNHKAPKKVQHQPHPHVPQQYGKCIQYAPIADTG